MFHILVQRVSRKSPAPSASLLKRWARVALASQISSGEMTIRIVDENEMTGLNNTYRQKNKSTNVLSFPFDMPEDVEMDVPLIGDLVICAAVVEREALEQHKTLDAHWAHMIVHGVLHLLGHDHEENNAAEQMEALEISILKSLGFSNPYQINQAGTSHE
jgi:probable rRNA maturation factor